jgi:endogenous inhibitor of DNA gyrase (YacG/DUF329 family)
MPLTVPCPTCAKPVPWTPESEFRPFCSERCRLIDLGEWLSEGHVIPEPLDGQSPGGEGDNPNDWPTND